MNHFKFAKVRLLSRLQPLGRLFQAEEVRNLRMGRGKAYERDRFKCRKCCKLLRFGDTPIQSKRAAPALLFGVRRQVGSLVLANLALSTLQVKPFLKAVVVIGSVALS